MTPFGGDFWGFVKGKCQIFSHPRRTHSYANLHPKSGPKWGSGHGGGAGRSSRKQCFGAVFVLRGPKIFHRRRGPSWPGRPCPAGRPAFRAGSPRSSRRVPGTSAERSSLPGGPPQLPSARMTCACVLVPMTKHASTLLTGPDRGAGAQGATAGYELLRRAAGRQGGLYGNFDIMFDRFSRICQLDTVRFNQSDNNTPRVCGRFG